MRFFGLLAVLLTLVLGDTGQKVLDEDGVGVLAELDRGALSGAHDVVQSQS
ncbi:MAG: hypothetical protein ROR55_08365 [Devosia sp.]